MRLRHSGYGRRPWPHSVVAFSHANGMCILSLTPCGLWTMSTIWEAYANEYFIEFNWSRCEMLFFLETTTTRKYVSSCLVNNAVVPVKEYIINLGRKISCDVSERHMYIVIAKFYKQYSLFPLTHWGRVTHTRVSKIISIGSDNALAPGRRQAIIWTNAGILLSGPLGMNFCEILIEINTFSFKKMHLNISSVKRWSFWPWGCELRFDNIASLVIWKVSCLELIVARFMVLHYAI